MKKRNKIILCICSILVIMASIFSFIPLKADKMTVSADTVTEEYYYNGSNIVSKTTFDNGSSSANLFKVNELIGNSFTKSGVTLTVNSDYTITLNGTCTGNNYFNTFTSFRDASLAFSTTNVLLLNSSNNYTFSLFNLGGSVFGSTNSALVTWFSSTIDGSINNYSFLLTMLSDLNNVFLMKTNVEYFNRGYIGVISGVTYNNFKIGISVTEGDNKTFVPYNLNHYLNFDFDFNTLFDSSTNLLNVTMKPTINNELNYTRVSNTNYSSIQPNYTFSTNTKGVLSTNTFSAYNSNTQLLDNNYIFKIKYMLDYIDSSGYDNTTNFNANISYIVLGSYLDARTYFLNDYIDNEIFTSKYNFISYVDINNNNLNIFIPLDSDISSDYFTFRTYFTSQGNNDSYLEGVNVGYSNGYINGQKEGETIGYNKGYNIGYNVGLNDSNQYTFLNLISATIDAPIRYFQSLFNFELLGVNLQGFITGLFTLCVIVTIIKLCLGR